MTDPPIQNPKSAIQNLRIALWCAVSSKPQAAPDKSSLADQEAAGRKFAAAVSGHVVHVYTVPGHSRDLIFWHDAEAAMDAYRDLRQDCQAHTFDVLFALDPDRLGRDPALSNQVISLVEKSGAEVYFASAPHPVGAVREPPSFSGHRYVVAIQTVRAAEDQSLRVAHHAAGVRARVRRGLSPNHYPTGYLPVRDSASGATVGAALDPAYAPVVRLVTAEFIKGTPYNAIVRLLNDSPYRPPRNGKTGWTFTVIWRMCHNDVYAGLPHWGDASAAEPSPFYPALWDAQTYRAVLRERARRPKSQSHKSAGSPLSGVVFCARCGYQMVRCTTRDKYHWLRCNNYNRRDRTGRVCHCNSIPEHKVLDAIAAFLVEIAAPEHLDMYGRSTACPSGRRERPAADHRLAEITAALADLDIRRERLALALAAGQLDPEMYHRTDQTLQRDVGAFEAEHAALEKELAALPDPEERRQAILALAPIFPQICETSPAPQIRALLQNIGLRVEVENGMIVSLTLV